MSFHASWLKFERDDDGDDNVRDGDDGDDIIDNDDDEKGRKVHLTQWSVMLQKQPKEQWQEACTLRKGKRD